MNSVSLYIGHRGCIENCEENTLLAFEKARECGANFIELDVRRTKDNRLIVIHDSNLIRTTNGSGEVHLMDYEEILKFSTKIEHLKIPLLSDVLEQFQSKIKFIVDLKIDDIWKDVSTLILEKGLLNECILSSRNLKDLLDFKLQWSKGVVCFNITKGIGYTLEQLLTSKVIPENVDMISLSSELVNSKFIETCHKNGVLALSWNFRQYKNSLKEIKKIIKMGIDGILFDDCINIPFIRKWAQKEFL